MNINFFPSYRCAHHQGRGTDHALWERRLAVPSHVERKSVWAVSLWVHERSWWPFMWENGWSTVKRRDWGSVASFPGGATTPDILTIWLPGTADYCLWWLRRVGWSDFNKTSLGAWEKAWTSSVLHGLGCNPQNCLSWLPSIVFLHHLIDQNSMSHTSTTWVKLQPESWDLRTGPIIYSFIDPPFHEWKDWKKKEMKQKCQTD